MPPSLAVLRLRAGAALAQPGLLGLAGSLLIAFASLGIGNVPKPDPLSRLPLMGLLRETVPGQALAVAALVAGSAVLLAAWLAVGRELRSGIGSGAGPGVGELRRMLWLWSLPLLLTPPLFSRDAYSYAAQGNLVRHGYDPYAVGAFVLPGPFADSVDPLWLGAGREAPYGPLFLVLAGGVSTLTGDSVYLGVLGMRALALAGVALLAVYLPRLAARCGVDPRGALWLGLVNPLTVMHFVSGAHNDALMVGLIVVGLTLAVGQGRLTGPVGGAVVLALGAGIKVPAAVVLGFVGHLWARRLGRSMPHLSVQARLLRGFALAGGTGVAAFAVLTAVTRFGYGWIGALGTPGSVHTWLSPPTALGMGLDRAARLLGAEGTALTWIDRTRSVSAVLAAVLILWLLLRRGAVDTGHVRGAVRTSALALFLLVALGPVVQPWYLMWALVPVAAGGLHRREAPYVLWGVVGCVAVSQLSGSTVSGLVTAPVAAACLLATGRVVARARQAERVRFGPSAVFDLAVVRPREVPEAARAPLEPVASAAPRR